MVKLGKYLGYPVTKKEALESSKSLQNAIFTSYKNLQREIETLVIDFECITTLLTSDINIHTLLLSVI